MALRDTELAARNEENAFRRSRLEMLASENQVLRREMSVQMYAGGNHVRSEGQGGFSGLSWFSRGFGNLIGGSASSKPPSPATRLMAPSPPPPPRLPSSVLTAETPRPPVTPAPRIREVSAVESSGFQNVSEHATRALPSRNPEYSSVQRALDFEEPLRARGSEEKTARAAPPEPPKAVPPEARAQDPLDVVLTGMAQLQGVVAGLANSPKADSKHEAIKPGVTSLPELPMPGPEACLLFSDWLRASKPALSDVSDSSEVLWDLVMKEAQAWYAKYLKLDAILQGSPLSRPLLRTSCRRVGRACLDGSRQWCWQQPPRQCARSSHQQESLAFWRL